MAETERQGAVFLDRDGVINALVIDEASGQPESPLHPEDVAILPGVESALQLLATAGAPLVVVSNQPAAAKGTVDLDDLAATHDRVVELLGESGQAVVQWRYCHHHPEALDPKLRVCNCRKPSSGMLLDAARELQLSLNDSWMVGDADRDVEAGRGAGCKTISIEHYGSRHRRSGSISATAKARDLSEAARIILNSRFGNMSP